MSNAPDTMPPPEVERVENKPAYVPLMLWPGAAPIYVPHDGYDDVASLMRGERGLMRDPGNEVEVRRVLDLGSNVGEFAVFCRLRFPYAWVDCVETNDERRAVCEMNAPAGTRVYPNFAPVRAQGGEAGYDLLRVTAGWMCLPHDRAAMLFFDGVHPSDVCNDAKPDGFNLVAQGMRAKHVPWSWWRRNV